MLQVRNRRWTTRRTGVRSLKTIAVVALAAGLPLHPAHADSANPWMERRVLNLAHAGGDLEAPHSTLFAMKSAVAAGADVIDLDVMLSADRVLMVQHDDTVDRTTNNTGPVSGYTAAQLGAMDNAHWFVPNCWSCRDRPDEDYTLRGIRTGAVPPPPGFVADDFGIPTLAQVRRAFPHRILNIEIKGSGAPARAAARALARFIEAHGPASGYVVVSFDGAITDYFKTLAPAVATSPGQDEMVEWFLGRGPMPNHQILQVPPTFGGIEVVSRQFVDDAHANGLAVWVWFNGEGDDVASEWQRLIDLGVDGLDTGKPAAAETVIDADWAGHAAPPRVGVRATQATSASLRYSCPHRHMATCRSRLLAVAQDRQGRWFEVGVVDARAGRTHTRTVGLPLSATAQRLLAQRALTVVVLGYPRNDDTAASATALRLGAR